MLPGGELDSNSLGSCPRNEEHQSSQKVSKEGTASLEQQRGEDLLFFIF